MVKQFFERQKEFAKKSVQRRQKRVKRIKEWMYGGHLYNMEPPASRAPGIPASNIIEERQLSHTLYELGQKRINYLHKYENDKQLFIENQRRKSKVIRRKLEEESEVESKDWTVAGDTNITREETTDMFDGVEYFPKPSERTQLEKLRLEILGRIHTNGKNSNIVKENTETLSRGKTVQFVNVFQTEPHFSRTATMETAKSHLVSRSPTFDRLPSIIRNSTKPRKAENISIPWGMMKSTSIQPGTHMPPITSDARYERLQDLLNPVYTTEQKYNVSDIVNEIGALHIKPKQVQFSRLAKEQKIKEFLRKIGFVI